jgi:hypothetical protein
MVTGAVAGNISPEATSPFGNIFADATRGGYLMGLRSRYLMLFRLPLPACCRASGKRNWERGVGG